MSTAIQPGGGAGSASGPTSSSRPASSSSTGERAVPYCCPFCTEEDLRPLESGAVAGLTRGGWHCRSCLRVFSISFHGVHPPVLADFSRNTGTVESERS
jgi:ribosomal protein L37AE/L43A